MARVPAILCCDEAVQARGLWTLVNVFDELRVAALSDPHAGFDVLVQLTDLRGQGEVVVEAELLNFGAEIDDPDQSLLWYDVVGLDVTPRLSRTWVRFRTGELRFRSAGVHEIRLLIDGKLAQTATLLVRGPEA